MAKLASFGAQAQQLLQRGVEQALRKEQVLREHPILAQIGRTTSAIAAQYAQPGSLATPILRGVGAFGADFFSDTPESLIQRAAQLQLTKFQTEGQVLNQFEDQRRLQLQEARIQQQQTVEEGRIKRAEETAKAAEIRGARRDYSTAARSGQILPESREQMVADLVASGESPKQAEAFADSKIKESAAARNEYDRRQREVEDRQGRHARVVAQIQADATKYGEKITTVVGKIGTINDDVMRIEREKEEATQFFSIWGGKAGIGKGKPTDIAFRLTKAINETPEKLGLDPNLRVAEITALQQAIPRHLAAISRSQKELDRRKNEMRLLIRALPADLRSVYESPVTPSGAAPSKASPEEAEIMEAFRAGRITEAQAREQIRQLNAPQGIPRLRVAR